MKPPLAIKFSGPGGTGPHRRKNFPLPLMGTTMVRFVSPAGVAMVVQVAVGTRELALCKANAEQVSGNRMLTDWPARRTSSAGAMSVTRTVKQQQAVLPLWSVALQQTSVSPIGICEPEGGVQTIVRL